MVTARHSFIVVGGLGVGKSTLLNKLIGVEPGPENEKFVTSRKPRACTQVAKTESFSYDGGDVAVTDLPGLYDMRLPLPVWLVGYGLLTKE